MVIFIYIIFIKLEINNRKISGKNPNFCKIKNTLLNNPYVKKNISREIKIF